MTPSNPDLGDPLGAVWALSSVHCPALYTKQSCEFGKQGIEKGVWITPFLNESEDLGRRGGACIP